MQYLLLCKHTGRVLDPAELAEIMLCPVCNTRQKLRAVECREWKVKCNDCTFGRWCGQSESEARRKANRHDSRHSVSVDYLIPERNRKLMQDMFGRKHVKRAINRDNIRFDPTILNAPHLTPMLKELPDKPPF